MAAWKASVSGSSCVRRRSSTGVRSAPPPNQALVVTTKRVFMCTVGTCGFHGWAISEMPDGPEARDPPRRRGSGRGIPGANSPWTVETCTPTFSNTRPRIMRHDAAAAGLAAMVGARPRLALEAARAAGLGSNGPVASSSSASKAAQIRSRRLRNQAGASVLRASSTAGSGKGLWLGAVSVM